jgi:hypothetical protein
MNETTDRLVTVARGRFNDLTFHFLVLQQCLEMSGPAGVVRLRDGRLVECVQAGDAALF